LNAQTVSTFPPSIAFAIAALLCCAVPSKKSLLHFKLGGVFENVPLQNENENEK
jgi:hypothetical protein